MTQVIMERYINSYSDMDAVEAEIAAQLGGEDGRCNFLRSWNYRLLRAAVFYKPDQKFSSVHHGGLTISYDLTDKGKLVTIKSSNPLVYPEEDEAVAWRTRKAQRLSAL